MPKGYWIAHIDVHTPERYDEYKNAAQPAYEEFGAVFIVRGGAYKAAEGDSRSRNVVIEFPSFEAAQACYNSDAYQKAKAIRQEISTGDIVIVEGA